MKEQTVIHNTFVIERSYAATPERLFAAFSDPTKKRRWFGGSEREVERFEMEFREGGSEILHYRLKPDTPFPGALLTNEAIYQDIEPGSRIVLASAMTLGGKRISVSLSTFEFLENEEGATLIFTHQGAFFEGSGGSEMREAGWQKLLGNLSDELSR